MTDNADHECTDGDRYYGTREQCPFCMKYPDYEPPKSHCCDTPTDTRVTAFGVGRPPRIGRNSPEEGPTDDPNPTNRSSRPT